MADLYGEIFLARKLLLSLCKQFLVLKNSIIATADSTGTSTAIYTYGPFGESSLTTGIRYGYTGQRSMAALGLLYYKARFYSPSLGRFLQPDPIGYADDLNLYAYVANNPVNFTDPSGLVVNWAKGIKLIPDDAPIYKIGAALGGVGAAAVGAATGDSNLFNTALDGLSATRADNIELLIMLGSIGRGGANSAVPKAGRYEFPDKAAGNVPYVGQSGNIPQRLDQHQASGRYEPGTAAITVVPGGKTAREISEHQRIQEITGGVPARQSGAVSNQVDPIGPKRQFLLPGS